MTIDRMQRVTFLAPRHQGEELVGLLQKLRLVHLEDGAARLGEAESFQRAEPSTQFAEPKLREPEFVEGVFDEFAPVRRGFIEGMVSLPMRVSETELRQVARDFDIRPLFEECQRISQSHKELERERTHAQDELAALSLFARLPFDVRDAAALKRVRVWIGSFGERKWGEFRAHPWAAERLAVQELVQDKRTVYVCVMALRSDTEEAAALLKEHEFDERPVPDLDVPAAQRTSDLRRKIEELRARSEAHGARVTELSAKRRQVAILRAYWEAELARLRAIGKGLSSQRIAVFTGYVRARDAQRLRQALARQMPGVSVLAEEPTPQDRVPVSLRLGPLLRAMSFLVNMFGLPDYFSFDPTPYLTVSFLVFFGFCFGDVVYGAMLCAVAGYLAWKARQYAGHRDLCVLFLYGGVTTIIFGALTGSWAADLWEPKYLGENNLLLQLKDRLLLVDPLKRPVLMLLVALGIGIANQMYGIVLRGYGSLRRGDWAAAAFDAGLWLVMIPGFLISAGRLFFPAMPGWLFRTGTVLAAAGGLGLVLTQGRREKTLPGKFITGLVSLYGILGSYGCVAFTGDMLSYARLLALGLTTSIVGMSCNIIAGLVKDLPYVGIVLFVLVVVIGHAFNFAISILGAFVHSARLIFLEFFGRFYEASGVRFSPLSLSTERILVTVSQTEGA